MKYGRLSQQSMADDAEVVYGMQELRNPMDLEYHRLSGEELQKSFTFRFLGEQSFYKHRVAPNAYLTNVIERVPVACVEEIRRAGSNPRRVGYVLTMVCAPGSPKLGWYDEGPSEVEAPEPYPYDTQANANSVRARWE